MSTLWSNEGSPATFKYDEDRYSAIGEVEIDEEGERVSLWSINGPVLKLARLVVAGRVSRVASDGAYKMAKGIGEAAREALLDAYNKDRSEA